MGPLFIQGSARSHGETRKAIQEVCPENRDIPIIDLNTFVIAPYDYDYRNQGDDYLPLMKRVVTYNPIILATPVYWYTMSAQMKIFLDRLSDLLDVAKDVGRQLRGKTIYVLASYNTSLPKGFEDPFSQTCEYMGMIYAGCSFIYGGKKPDLREKNISEIEKVRHLLFERQESSTP
jgi:putative NADPH-quinone reductase